MSWRQGKGNKLKARLNYNRGIVMAVDDAHQQAAKLRSEADRIDRICERFPDVVRRVDRWNREYWCSPSVNPIATEALISHNCGCCNDSPVQVRAFVELEGGLKVFADPYTVFVGEKDPRQGRDRRYPDWREQLAQARLSEEVIAKVNRYFGAEGEVEVESEQAD